MLGRPTLWARIPAPGGFNGSDTIDMLLHNSKTGGFESMTSKRYARRCPTSDQKGGCRPRIRKRGYRGSRKIFAGENIDGKENGEAAGLDERGHSYTQDPRAREDKDHGSRAPIEAKRGHLGRSGENEYLPIRPIIALAPARCCAHSTQPRSLAGQRHSLGASTTAFPVIARNRIAWLQLRRSVAAHPMEDAAGPQWRARLC